MIECNEWNQTLFQAFVNQAMVKGDPFLIHFPYAIRQDAGPGNGKTKDPEPQGLYEHQVIFVAVIEIAGDRWLTSTFDPAMTPRKYIPNR